MSEQLDFDNPTREEAQRFRKKLFEQLLFEPIADVDFVRPAAKLRSLVQDSEAMMKQLRAVWNKYDDLLASLNQLIPMLERIKPVIDPMLQIGFTPLPLAHSKYAVPVPDVNHEEHDEGRALYDKWESLRTIAQKLVIQFHSSMNPADIILRVRVAGSQLRAGQLWAFLARVTQRVAKGNEHVFEHHLFPDNIRELLSDTTEKAIEEAELPNPIPFLHLFSAMFAFIRRKEIREREFDKSEQEMDTNVFLSSYFSWWTDGNGRSTLGSITADFEKILQSHDEAVQLLLRQSREFMDLLPEFKTLAKYLVEHPTDETENTPSKQIC